MSPHWRLLAHVVGLTVFVGALTWSWRTSPFHSEQLQISWLSLAVLLSLLSLLCQAAQNFLFIWHEGATAQPRWALWVAAEKAWLNAVSPARLGTVAAILVIRKMFALQWQRYLSYQFLCAGLTLLLSAMVGGMMLLPELRTVSSVLGIYLLGLVAVRSLFRQAWPHFLCLVLLSMLNFACLTGGVATAVWGLGYEVTLVKLLPVGVLLNLLSVVSITPGNFGIREIVIGALAPLLHLNIAVLMQGAAAFVLLRIAVSFVVATMLRDHSLTTQAGP